MNQTDVESLAPIECTVGLRKEQLVSYDWDEHDGDIDGELTGDGTPRQDVQFDIEYDPELKLITLTNDEDLSFVVDDISTTAVPRVFLLLTDSIVINIDTMNSPGPIDGYDQVELSAGDIRFDTSLEFWQEQQLTSALESQSTQDNTTDRSGVVFECSVCGQHRPIDSPLATIKLRCESCESFQRFHRVEKN